MSNTLTVRLPEETIDWLRETSRRTGIPVGQLVREQVEAAKRRHKKQPFLRHAGALSGPADLSSRKGYRRK